MKSHLENSDFSCVQIFCFFFVVVVVAVVVVVVVFRMESCNHRCLHISYCNDKLFASTKNQTQYLAKRVFARASRILHPPENSLSTQRGNANTEKVR